MKRGGRPYPSRYAGHGGRTAHAALEQGAVIKRWTGRLSVALVFPDTYALGMSNIGFQHVYQGINSEECLVAERFFLPDADSSYPGPGSSGSWRSIESSRLLHEFDFILFSISFETGYVNIARALLDAGITLYAAERREDEPMVLAGGVACQINPEPAALFIDAFLLGDFEELGPSFMPWLAEYPETTSASRINRLLSLALLCPGTYVPAAYGEVRDIDGRLTGWKSAPGFPETIRPALFTGIPEVAPHTSIISSRAVFSSMSLVELARGCGRGCRFCSAGFIYRPPRPWPEKAINAAFESMRLTSKTGLVGLEFLERDDVMRLCEKFVEKKLDLAFSSLRADAVTERFVQLLKRSRVKTATIAPEAGTERMRRIINKNLSENAILAAAEIIARGGIPNIKCYFMLGLPFERDEDVEGIISLVDKIRVVALNVGRSRGHLGTVTVSAGIFVPKAWTPFQWAGMIRRDAAEKKQAMLKKAFRSMPNVKFRYDSWNSAFFQAILSRGDRSLAPVLAEMAEKGVSFKKAVMNYRTGTDKICKGFREDETQPWEIITHRVRKSYLLREWKSAATEKQTSFCDTALCRRCGACGYK